MIMTPQLFPLTPMEMGFLNCDNDCDDSNPFVYPCYGFAGDMIDQDCDGVDATSMLSLFSAMHVVLTSIKIQCSNPYDSNIESMNPK